MLKALRLLVIFIFIWGCVSPSKSGQASSSIITKADAHSQAEILLNNMTPEERVGQLFLVTFQGTDTSPTSQIYDLVINRHVGGVILRADNNNIPTQDNVPQFLNSFTTTLQTLVYDASRNGTVNPITGEDFKPQFAPIFIGISQGGDGYPTDQIINGFTSLPSQLAVGATWQPELAFQAGSVAGSELQAAGINLLLGPSLDVLESPRTVGGLDLGIRTFGGDPFWVGEMANAYISGVHAGSLDRVLIVAKHFPGYGSSDRLPGDEVATVRKSLEQLKQIELAPFLAVCGDLGNEEHVTDALLVSHIRFQGFQGNIRATTRPVSFDATALAQLISLPVITEWRNQGGLLISDDLGSKAVRRFYDPAEKIFDARQVARNAFLAGNDMLYMGNMRSNTDPDSYTSIIHTLDSFTQKYDEDPTFAARVDSAALKVLTKKYVMYTSFDLGDITKSPLQLGDVGHSGNVTFDILQLGATLISPDEQNLVINLPDPPAVNENLVFFTSTLVGKQCTNCLEQTIFSADGLEKAVLQNYGPPNSSQVRKEMTSSYSFKDLSTFLANGIPPENLEIDLSKADWVIFSLLDVTNTNPETEALRTLLSNRYDLVRNKKLIVFAFSAPYYLDATEISKITAYYGIYSKVPSALDVAARILYHEITPTGASPVSIAGTGYDLIEVTAPNPDQVIPLEIDSSESSIVFNTQTPQSIEVPLFNVGDKLPLRTGVIQDLNGHPVPDGTTTRFIITRTTESTATITTQQIDAVTQNGVATGQFTIDSKGLYVINVVSEPAMVSQILQLNVINDSGAVVTALAPTPKVEMTPNVGEESNLPLSQTPDITNSPEFPMVGIWLAALIILMGEVSGAYYLFKRSFALSNWCMRVSIIILITGWLAYLYPILGLPGSTGLSGWSILLITTIGGCVGLLVTLVWRWGLLIRKQID